MPGAKRDAALFGVITRSEFAEILEKARRGYGSGSELGYVRQPENAVRDAALLAWEYLSGKRVSELVGRKFYDDIYAGLTMDKVKISRIGSKEVLQFYVRILKRGRKKKLCIACNSTNPADGKYCKKCGASLHNAQLQTKLKEVWKWKSLLLDDPFARYIMDWISYLQAKNYQGRIFPLTRQAAWRIMRNLGINNHINRHWRATHLAAAMNDFELKEFLDRATVPVEYVHAEPTKQLEKTMQADLLWAGET